MGTQNSHAAPSWIADLWPRRNSARLRLRRSSARGWWLSALAVLFIAAGARAADPNLLPLVEDAFSFGASREANTIAYLQAAYGSTYLNSYPRSTSLTPGPTYGKWTTSDANTLQGWTAGFFPGSLWMLYGHTGGAAWLSSAKAFTAGVEIVKNNPLDTDLGFRLVSSVYTGYRLSNDVNDPGGVYRAHARDVLVTAANTIDASFNWNGVPVGTIKSLDGMYPHYANWIDEMMDIRLLYTAWDASGRPTSGPVKTLYDHAVTQSFTELAQHVRSYGPGDARASDDGSVYQIVQHNDGLGGTPADGSVYRKFTNQGFGSESTWSRGQAWAMYGFTEAYNYTRSDPSVDSNQFLSGARRTCDYFISHLPNNTSDPYNHRAGDFIPPTDFDASLGEPNGPWNDMNGDQVYGDARPGTHKLTFRDSSAAAAGASALLELSTLDPDPAERQRYFQAAEDILRSLLTFRGDDGKLAYLAKDSAHMGILTEAAGAYSATDTGCSWSFADYYFLEALQRYEAIVVPEPATGCLLLLGLVGIARRRRR